MLEARDDRVREVAIDLVAGVVLGLEDLEGVQEPRNVVGVVVEVLLEVLVVVLCLLEV